MTEKKEKKVIPFREDVNIHDCWLQPKCFSIRQVCIFFIFKLLAAGCRIWGLKPMNFDVSLSDKVISFHLNYKTCLFLLSTIDLQNSRMALENLN